MRIRYYLARIKNSIIYGVRNYQLRKNNTIGRNCRIHKSAVLKGNVVVGNDVNIGINVILGKNVKIGSNTVLRNIIVGENSHIEGNVIVTGYGDGTISIGKECYIGVFNVLDFSADISIGDYVHIAGPSTGLWTHTSAKMCINGDRLDNKTPENRPTSPILIESNVYIGGNCTIYPGITIKDHVIVAPNSVVNRDPESYTLIGGVPAKEIKKPTQTTGITLFSMNNKGQSTSVWTETWSKRSIESDIRMWDYYGGRPWIVKYTPRYGKVLEAGCGLGRYNFYLSHLGIDITGLDFSADTIAFLNKWKVLNGYNIPFIEGDICHLPFDDCSLSGYLSFGVVEHFIEGPAIPLAEASRVLRPGGIAIITTPNHTWSKKVNRTIFFIKQEVKKILGREVKKKEFFQYEYSAMQLKKHIGSAGLKVTVYTGTDFLYTFSEFGIRIKQHSLKLPWFYKLSKLIDNSILKKFGAQSVTISVKTAEKMHCFLCDSPTAGLSSLDNYNVPVCVECEKTNLSGFYKKTSKTYFHHDYIINHPVVEPHEQVCSYCGTKYITHPVFEHFGFSRNVCQPCLKMKEINIDLSNNFVKPAWRTSSK